MSGISNIGEGGKGKSLRFEQRRLKKKMKKLRKTTSNWKDKGNRVKGGADARGLCLDVPTKINYS